MYHMIRTLLDPIAQVNFFSGEFIIRTANDTVGLRFNTLEGD